MLLTCLEKPRSELFPPKISEQVDRAIWGNGTAGVEVNIETVNINLKGGVQIPQKKQYPLKKEVLQEIQPALQKFLKSELIPDLKKTKTFR